MDLRANAIITAVDRFSGPMQRMAGAVNAFNARAASVAAGAKRAGSAMAAPVALGLGAMIARTQEFEKKALGAKIASIADAMERVGDGVVVNHAKIRQEGEAIKNSALAVSKELGMSPAGLMEAAEAAAKMGLELKKADAVMRTSAILKMADPEIGFGKAAEFLGTLGLQFKAPKEVDAYAEWIKATGDKIATVASATRTSVSRIEEGFRQFSGVFATFGATVDQSGALIGAMTQGGLLDAESGTALKSAALRFVRPTLEGLSAMNAAQIDRRNYMDLTGADPRRATNQLMQLFTGYLGKKDKMYLTEQLAAAQKAGRGADPAFIDRIAAYINKKTGGKETLDDTYGKVLNTITTAGGQVDIFKFLSDISKGVKEGRITDAQLATIFEGRHLARMKTLFNMWDEVERILKLSTPLKGEGLDATVREYQGSAFGRWEMALASFDRALIRLRESEGITNLISQFERLATAVASMDQGKVEMIGQLATALLTLGTAGMALGGIAAGVLAINAAIAYLAASPLLLIATGLTAIGAALYKLSDGFRSVVDRVASAASALADGRFSDAAGIATGRLTTDGLSKAELDKLSNAFNAATSSTSVPDTGNARAGWSGMGGGLVRDIDPAAGPRTIDVTGKVQADVQGKAEVSVDNKVRIEIEGPGRVIEQSGGKASATVPLNTGAGMADTKGN